MQHPANTHHIECKFHDANGCIERLLRVVRVRGFRVSELRVGFGNNMYTARLVLEGERAVKNLQAQLEKLVDIIEVEIFDTDATSATLLEKCA